MTMKLSEAPVEWLRAMADAGCIPLKVYLDEINRRNATGETNGVKR